MEMILVILATALVFGVLAGVLVNWARKER